MPRQRSRSAAQARGPSRPVVAPARPNVAPPQQRLSSTAAHSPVQSSPNSQASNNPGLFGQMATTAAWATYCLNLHCAYAFVSGVAVGSSIGHALGGLFGGSGSMSVESHAGDGVVASESQGEAYKSTSHGNNCEAHARSFTKCLDENKGNDYQMSICGWYLEQLVSFHAHYMKLWITKDDILIIPYSLESLSVRC